MASAAEPRLEALWRPSYLQRSVLVGFAAVFGLLIILLQILYAISSRNQGLGSNNSDFNFLWTYGPAAAMTLLAVAWGRVFFQVQLTAPWQHMQHGPTKAENSVLLDYLAMIPPKTMIKAIANRGWVVAFSAVVWLAVELLIIISTGLITKTPILITRLSVPITVQDAFVDSNVGLGVAQTLDLYTMVGVNDGNLSYPMGTTSSHAFQSWRSDIPFDIELRATVEGYSAGLDCEKASITDLKMIPSSATKTYLLPSNNEHDPEVRYMRNEVIL
jgi:hypothetical protein